MKDLERVQKAAKVFKVLLTIVIVCGIIMTVSFLGVYLMVGNDALPQEVYGLLADSLGEELVDIIEPILLTTFVVVVTETVFAFFGRGYLNSVLKDGTPFAAKSAKKLRTVGILSIVLPICVDFVGELIYAFYEVPEGIYPPSIEQSIYIGVLLILISFAFSYGAQLVERAQGLETELAQSAERAEMYERKISFLEAQERRRAYEAEAAQTAEQATGAENE